MEAVIIGFDEARYYIALGVTLLFFLLLLATLRRLDDQAQNTVVKIIGALCLVSSIAIHPILIFSDDLNWTIQKALPLHLCGFNYLLIGFNCFLKNRRIWEITLFLGLIGGFHSLLTPELPQGDSAYFLVFYYFEHGILLFMPILYYILFDFRLDRKSWLRVFLLTNVFAVGIFALNWVINTYLPSDVVANYFYLWEPPKANNPIIQGEWPWYLIPFEGAMLLHMFVIQKIFRKKPLS